MKKKTSANTSSALPKPHPSLTPKKTEGMGAQIPKSNDVIFAEMIQEKMSAHFDRLAFFSKTNFGKENCYLDDAVACFITDFHHGKKRLPPVPWTVDGDGDFMTYDLLTDEGNWDFMTYELMRCVVQNDAKGLRRIAESVTRVHKLHTSGEGPSFVIHPADTVRARVLAYVEKNGRPQDLAQTREIMLRAGFIPANLDEREVSRWHKDLGGASGKRGRPSKTKVAPKVEKPAVVSLKEIRARATATSAKLPRLLDQKPVAKNRTKRRETPP